MLKLPRCHHLSRLHQCSRSNRRLRSWTTMRGQIAAMQRKRASLLPQPSRMRANAWPLAEGCTLPLSNSSHSLSSQHTTLWACGGRRAATSFTCPYASCCRRPTCAARSMTMAMEHTQQSISQRSQATSESQSRSVRRATTCRLQGRRSRQQQSHSGQSQGIACCGVRRSDQLLRGSLCPSRYAALAVRQQPNCHTCCCRG